MNKTFKRLSDRLLRGLGRIHSDETGQGIILSVISLVILTFFVGTVYRVGYLSSNRIRVQSVADATAFSMAVTQANAISALAWINEGMAATHYHLCRYAVDVIVAAVDLEFVDPGPRSPDRQPDPNTDKTLSVAQAAYDAAYARALENIPAGKQYIRELAELQQTIIDRIPNNILRAAVYKEAGAAFAMSEGHDGRRGVRLATLFPDFEEFDLNNNNYLEDELNTERFGIEVGVEGARHPQESDRPAWTQWFDTGIRGSEPGSTDVFGNPAGEGLSWHGWRYYDAERSFFDGTNSVWNLKRRTFARIGRLYIPDYRRDSRSTVPHLLEKDSGAAENTGRGYDVGDTLLNVTSVLAFRDQSGANGEPHPDNAANPYMVPFFVRFSSLRMEVVDGNDQIKSNPATIFEVTAVLESTNQLRISGAVDPDDSSVRTSGLPFEIWIWTQRNQPCEEEITHPITGQTVTIIHGSCEELGSGTNIEFWWRSNPSIIHGRFLLYTDVNDQPQQDFKPIFISNHDPSIAYHQTRGPCWDSREIRQSETPSEVLTGPTGYIYDPTQDQVIACPTCGHYEFNSDGTLLSALPGVDRDGDRKTDVRLFAWHTFPRQDPASPDLDENDFMDARVFREFDEFAEDVADDALATANESAYGEAPSETGKVLTAEFFKWGFNAALWMPKVGRNLILPDDPDNPDQSWEPWWGYFCIASARTAVFDGEWVVNFDDAQTRQSWLDSDSNLYRTDWQARLVQVNSVIKDFDAQGFSSGLQMVFDKLVQTNLRTYEHQGNVLGQALPTATASTLSPAGNPGNFDSMANVLLELLSPTNPETQHGIDFTSTNLKDIVHH